LKQLSLLLVKLSDSNLVEFKNRIQKLDVDKIKGWASFEKYSDLDIGGISKQVIWKLIGNDVMSNIRILKLLINAHIIERKSMKAKIKRNVIVTKPDGVTSEMLNHAEEMINEAQKEIILLGYDYSSFGNFIKRLESANKRGVNLKVIGQSQFVSKIRKDLRNFHGDGEIEFYAFDKTAAGDIIYKVKGREFGYPKFHAKVIVVDQMQGLVSSANLTVSGMTCNVEIGTMIKRDEVKTILPFLRELLKKGIIYKYENWT